MLIVEGPDGAGKSTLCEMLRMNGVVEQVLPSPRVPAKGNAERMKYETGRYLRLYESDNSVVVDRFLFSEMAYGKVLRGKSVFSRAEYLDILVKLMLGGSFVIFCLPDTLNFKVDENPVAIKKIEEIREQYNKLAQDQALTSDRTYIYRWNEPDAFPRLLQFLKGFR